MKQIKKREYGLVGKTIYLEKSDCSYWKLTDWRDNQGCYDAVKLGLDDEPEQIGETRTFTPNDLIGNYML